MIGGLDATLRTANRDNTVKVIVLQGAGDHFCAGFDFSDGLDHVDMYREDGYDPGVDVFKTSSAYTSGIAIFMGLWRGLKPTVAKVRATASAPAELALAADLVIAAHDARFGTPYSRVWGCHLTGMSVYRLGLAGRSTTPSPASGSAAATPSTPSSSTPRILATSWTTESTHSSHGSPRSRSPSSRR